MLQKVVRVRSRIGGRITFTLETGLSLEGEPNYALPDELTPAFAQAWMELPVGEELFIGEIMSQVAATEKRRFSAFCRDAYRPLMGENGDPPLGMEPLEAFRGQLRRRFESTIRPGARGCLQALERFGRDCRNQNP